jgi:hypothetical protein
MNCQKSYLTREVAGSLFCHAIKDLLNFLFGFFVILKPFVTKIRKLPHKTKNASKSGSVRLIHGVV